MSSILDAGENRQKCQKFTPPAQVTTMLNLASYNSNLMGKTILENSFGSGNVLKELVKRYIESAEDADIAPDKISYGLSQDIYGVELDKVLYDKCVSDLNEFVRSHHLPSVTWKLFNVDALAFDFGVTFDYIIGNPPYISYKEIDRENRKKIKQQFYSCSVGKFDYCYAFIERGIKLLKPSGKLVQLIPNNIYKNVFAQKLREMLSDHIAVIMDYPDQKLFDDALTSISIFLYDKGNTCKCIDYQNITQKSKRVIHRDKLGEKWIFVSEKTLGDKPLRFGDIFQASSSVATLCNKAFLVTDEVVMSEELEEKTLRNAVSPKALRYKKKQKIIFPYKYENGLIQHYSEEEFVSLYPHTVNHLQAYFDKLENRASDKRALWFEYGRTQALAHINEEKLLLSTVITHSIDVYKINAYSVPFSGIYITVKNPAYTLDDALTVLKSDDFFQYVQCIGVSVSGKSMRITSNDINNYTFSKEVIPWRNCSM